MVQFLTTVCVLPKVTSFLVIPDCSDHTETRHIKAELTYVAMKTDISPSPESSVTRRGRLQPVGMRASSQLCGLPGHAPTGRPAARMRDCHSQSRLFPQEYLAGVLTRLMSRLCVRLAKPANIKVWCHSSPAGQWQISLDIPKRLDRQRPESSSSR